MAMRIATYNVNGINGRLANLLGWLEEAAPDIVCVQELKAPDEKFPATALLAAGYGAVWHGQKSWNGVSILARGGEPVETRRGLPGDPDDAHSRYLEAPIGSVLVGCLYLPNGNPAPGEIRQQQRMKDCNTQASGMTGDARKQFMSSCLSGLLPRSKAELRQGQAVRQLLHRQGRGLPQMMRRRGLLSSPTPRPVYSDSAYRAVRPNPKPYSAIKLVNELLTEGSWSLFCHSGAEPRPLLDRIGSSPLR